MFSGGLAEKQITDEDSLKAFTRVNFRNEEKTKQKTKTKILTSKKWKYNDMCKRLDLDEDEMFSWI